MEISELIKRINIGNVPITVYVNEIYEGIYCFVSITKKNTVFLDYDDESIVNSEGGFRATFIYETLEKMICSLVKYTKLDIENWTPIYIDSENINRNGDWISFKRDLYYHKVPFLTGYDKMIIGDIYWRGLYNKEISPNATIKELMEWFEKRI